MNDEKCSLKQRLLNKIVVLDKIENAHSDMKTSIQQKEITDAEKLYADKAMLQVIV